MRSTFNVNNEYVAHEKPVQYLRIPPMVETRNVFDLNLNIQQRSQSVKPNIKKKTNEDLEDLITKKPVPIITSKTYENKESDSISNDPRILVQNYGNISINPQLPRKVQMQKPSPQKNQVSHQEKTNQIRHDTLTPSETTIENKPQIEKRKKSIRAIIPNKDNRFNIKRCSIQTIDTPSPFLAGNTKYEKTVEMTALQQKQFKMDKASPKQSQHQSEQKMSAKNSFTQINKDEPSTELVHKFKFASQTHFQWPLKKNEHIFFSAQQKLNLASQIEEQTHREMTLEYDTSKLDTHGEDYKSSMNVVNIVNDYTATKDSGFNDKPQKDIPIKANIRHYQKKPSNAGASSGEHIQYPNSYLEEMVKLKLKLNNLKLNVNGSQLVEAQELLNDDSSEHISKNESIPKMYMTHDHNRFARFSSLCTIKNHNNSNKFCRKC